MIVLVLSVCLMAEANTCKDVHLTYSAESVTPMQCMMGGQAQIAQWVNGHPQWAGEALEVYDGHAAGEGHLRLLKLFRLT